MTTVAEAYAKLKAPRPTPPSDLCRCAKPSSIKLVAGPGFNPIRCVGCNLEVSPESLKLSVEQAEAVAQWNAPAEGIYRLWIASGEYEVWAGRQLSDPDSPINVDGRRLAEELNPARRCYFWLPGDEGYDACPACGGELSKTTGSTPQAFCDDCSVIGPAAES